MKTLPERLREFAWLKGLVVRVNTFLDRPIERRLNINTASLKISPDQKAHRTSSFADGNRFETLPYWLILHCLKPMKIGPEDVVYDIGCGLGRWVCYYSCQHVKKCVGVEICAEFAEIARRNAASLVCGHKGAPIEIIAQDAPMVDYSDGTVFLLFNPFGPKTASAVLARIRESLKSRPRTIRIAYFYPVHEDVYQSCGWLKCFARRKVPGFTRARASMWTNPDPSGNPL